MDNVVYAAHRDTNKIVYYTDHCSSLNKAVMCGYLDIVGMYAKSQNNFFPFNFYKCYIFNIICRASLKAIFFNPLVLYFNTHT